MIGKAGLVAAIAIAAVTSGRHVDLRGLYDQMYPVSTLKRDALYLCHESDLTFVRASGRDRSSCYSNMPHAIALALGFVHPTSALAGLFGGGFVGTGSLLADVGLASRAAMSREAPLTARTAPGKEPCRGAVAGLAETPPRAIDTEAARYALSGRRGAPGESGIEPVGIPRQSDSLTLLDDLNLGATPAKQLAPAIGCAAPS
ncbi:MAG TPA: hypothetical protein VHW66_07965 [Stellaceae bacterium]|jgi:hypothetical protein|nr:hypothetical protein [Stellaceae bacterium]